jgi:circadian clock protein KaiC
MPSTERVSTATEGLDVVLGGGLPRNRLYLIEGIPGTGKTTLALKFLLQGIGLGERGLYVTLSETKEELQAAADSHGWDLSAVDIYELAPEDVQPNGQYTVFHPSELELGITVKALLDHAERTRPVRMVYDSLSEMQLLAGSALRYRRQIRAMKQFFAGRGCTVLLLDDQTAEGSDLQLQSIAHGVIVLHTLAPEYGGARRRLQVMKMRGVDFQAGYHDYVIERGGLRVFPRLIATEHGRPFAEEMVTSGVPALDALFGGLARGTTTLFLGPAGSGKSLVAAQVAAVAASCRESVAFFLFDEGLSTFLRGTAGIGIDLRGHIDAGRVTIQPINPAELSPGQFVHTVRDAVERRRVRVVVIDSLNGYMNSMPEERLLTTHLHELFAYLRQSGVITLAVMTQHGLIGSMLTNVDVSDLADTVVLLRYFEARGAVLKAISMMKKRASKHEATIRELSIDDRGIHVGSPLHDFRGILTGVPDYVSGTPAQGNESR